MISKTYYTHDNGSRYFKVIVNSNTKTVTVYREIAFVLSKKESIYSKTPSVKFHYNKVFIGNCPNSNILYGKHFGLGNSILVHIKDLDYVIIQHLIYRFKAEATIIKFISPIGNNDVPYPYAIDNKGNYYLTLEYVIVKNPNKKIIDVYKHYYTKFTTVSNKSPSNKSLDTFKIKEFSIAHEKVKNKLQTTLRLKGKSIMDFKIGSHSYWFNTQQAPARYYDVWMQDIKKDKYKNMRFITNDGKNYIISRAQYIQIDRKVKRFMGIKNMKGVKIIQKRTKIDYV